MIIALLEQTENGSQKRESAFENGINTQPPLAQKIKDCYLTLIPSPAQIVHISDVLINPKLSNRSHVWSHENLVPDKHHYMTREQALIQSAPGAVSTNSLRNLQRRLIRVLKNSWLYLYLGLGSLQVWNSICRREAWFLAFLTLGDEECPHNSGQGVTRRREELLSSWPKGVWQIDDVEVTNNHVCLHPNAFFGNDHAFLFSRSHMKK